MKRIMVRYKVKTDRVKENETYIRNVFKALADESPSGLRYVSFKLEDGVSFVHIVSLESESGDNPLGRLPAFKAFAADIADRCEEPPVVTSLEEVGSYR